MDWPRLFRRVAIAAILIATLAWPADYAVWTLRGSPTATVEVTRFVVAPLKGSKEEYYPDGTAIQPCSQSLLPQSATPCWYLQRNRTTYTYSRRCAVGSWPLLTTQPLTGATEGKRKAYGGKQDYP